jgi:hypothetical protein
MVTRKDQERVEFAQLFWLGNSYSVIYRDMLKRGFPVALSTLKSWGVRLKGNPAAFLSGQKRERLGNPRARRKGAPPLTAADKFRLQEIIRANPEQSLRTTAAHLPKNLKASKSTLQRVRPKSGLKPRHKVKKPKLTRAQRRVRRQFAAANIDREWALVVFSDEFTCTTAGQSACCCVLLCASLTYGCLRLE